MSSKSYIISSKPSYQSSLDVFRPTSSASHRQPSLPQSPSSIHPVIPHSTLTARTPKKPPTTANLPRSQPQLLPIHIPRLVPISTHRTSSSPPFSPYPLHQNSSVEEAVVDGCEEGDRFCEEELERAGQCNGEEVEWTLRSVDVGVYDRATEMTDRPMLEASPW